MRRWGRRKRLVEVTFVVNGGILWRGYLDARRGDEINVESTRPVSRGKYKIVVSESGRAG